MGDLKKVIFSVFWCSVLIVGCWAQGKVAPGVAPQHYQQQQVHHQQQPQVHQQQQVHHQQHQQAQYQQQHVQYEQHPPNINPQVYQHQVDPMYGQVPQAQHYEQQVHHQQPAQVQHHPGQVHQAQHQAPQHQAQHQGQHHQAHTPDQPYQQQVLNAQNIHNEKDHIAEHLEANIDTSKMTDQELQFHYFKMHDADHNNKLDGCELIKSLIHWHAQGSKHDQPNVPNVEEKIFSDEELTALIDPILQTDDISKDGFIDYPEFIRAQQKTGVAGR